MGILDWCCLIGKAEGIHLDRIIDRILILNLDYYHQKLYEKLRVSIVRR